MKTVKVKLPNISAGLISNILGILGLIAIVIAIGGLTGNWWWALLAGGLFGVALGYMAGLQSEGEIERAKE